MTRLSYPAYRQKSGWNALLAPRQPEPTLAGDLRADVAIIGAGYTGIAAAVRWAERAPGDEIAVIDSSEIGEGNPGRNSGFLLEIALANDADPRQMARMNECNRLIGATMEQIRETVAASGIDCGLERAGTYRAAAGDVGMQALRQYGTFLEAAGLPYEWLNRDELEARLGTAFYREGLYSPHCYLAQPAALIRALATRLPQSATLYENTPAITLRGDRGGWRIETPGGSICAPKVILANNAFSKQLGIGGSRMVAVYTYAGLTEPLPGDVLESLGSESNWGLLPTHRLGSTLRRTDDGRLLVRSYYGYEREDDNALVAERLRKNLLARFPRIGAATFESVWGGATGFTWNGAPIWGEAKPGLFVSSGCNGGGVVKGTLFGGLLADLANGRNVPDVAALFGRASWMPPDPFRRIGFRLISTLERYRGRAEM